MELEAFRFQVPCLVFGETFFGMELEILRFQDPSKTKELEPSLTWGVSSPHPQWINLFFKKKTQKKISTHDLSVLRRSRDEGEREIAPLPNIAAC